MMTDNKSDSDSIEIHLAKEMTNIPRTSSTPTPVVGIPGGTKPQTIFIHKLYDMLEDGNISHLIWWTENCESFGLLPGEEFSKVLAQYFKHTNIASFIRQLNMYGFHKVNDAGQSENGGDNNVSRWEFRHLANHFRKGDIESLKLIKRRSSKNINHTREAAKTAGGTEDDIHEAVNEGDTKGIHTGDQHDVKAHEQQQHYHQTLQLQQQDQIPQPPSAIQHHHLAQIDGAPSPSVLPPLSKLPQIYKLSSDKSLETRLNEATSNLVTLRHEHHQLQTQFDLVFNEQKKSQFDLIQLVEIMQRHAVKSEDDKKLDYELTNFKQVLLNKFNNLHVLLSQAQGHQTPTIHPQHLSHAHPSMKPQYNSSHLHYSYSQSSADSNTDSSNIETQKLSKNGSKQPVSDGPMAKDVQPPYTYAEKFLEKNNIPTSLHSPHTSEVRRGYQQYPFPNMNSDPRASAPSTPDLFGQSVPPRVPLPSTNTYEQRPQSIPTPNSSLSLSRLALSNSSVSSGSSYSSNISVETPPKLVPLPSVSELDKLIKNGGGGLPLYRMLNSYGPMKRKNSTEEETRKRQA